MGAPIFSHSINAILRNWKKTNNLRKKNVLQATITNHSSLLESGIFSLITFQKPQLITLELLNLIYHFVDNQGLPLPINLKLGDTKSQAFLY